MNHFIQDMEVQGEEEGEGVRPIISTQRSGEIEREWQQQSKAETEKSNRPYELSNIYLV